MPRGSALRALLALACACLLPVPARSDFHRGDLVSASRRAQFHGSRTHWHDLLARHCPTFAVDRVVALPIPKPLSFRPDDEYKIALSFDGDRHATTWLPILAPSSSPDGNPDPVPMLDVELVHGHGHVLAARADVVAVSPEYLRRHAELVREFQSPETWPKHLLVRYRWTERVDVDANAGLGVALGVCAALSIAAFASACAAYAGEISDAVDAMAAEDSRAEAARRAKESRRAKRFAAGGEGETSQSRARRMDATRERHVGVDEGGR